MDNRSRERPAESAGAAPHMSSGAIQKMVPFWSLATKSRPSGAKASADGRPPSSDGGGGEAGSQTVAKPTMPTSPPSYMLVLGMGRPVVGSMGMETMRAPAQSPAEPW